MPRIGIVTFPEMPPAIFNVFKPMKHRYIPVSHPFIGFPEQIIVHGIVAVIWIHSAQQNRNAGLLQCVFDTQEIVFKNALDHPAVCDILS